MENAKPRVRVLLVDDEDEFLLAMSRALAHRGLEVATAADGPAALEQLAADPPDVAVLDVKMPGIQGDELFRIVHRRWPELPVIVLTGHGTVQQAFETSKAGLFEYATKPVDPDRFASLIRAAAASHRRRRFP